MPTYHQLNNENIDNMLSSSVLKVIYCNCCLSLIACLVLIIIAGYLLPISQDAGIIINDAGKTLEDLNIIIPEVKHTLQMVYKLCQFENFTKHYQFLCEE